MEHGWTRKNRSEKPVEVEALWIAALKALSELAEIVGDEKLIGRITEVLGKTEKIV